MKGALAAMLLAVADLRDYARVRVRLGVVPDEESEEEVERGGDLLVAEGFLGDFVITGEPTDMHVGVAAKGVRRDARARSTGAPRTGRRRGWARTRSCARSTYSARSSRYRLRPGARSSSTARRSTSAGSSAATR